MNLQFLNRILFLFLFFIFFVSFNLRAQVSVGPVTELSRDVVQVSGFKYEGTETIDSNEAELLLATIDRRGDSNHLLKDDLHCDCESYEDSAFDLDRDQSSGDDWRIALVARITARSTEGEGQTLIEIDQEAKAAFDRDLKSFGVLSRADALDSNMLSMLYSARSRSFDQDPLKAMSYIAAMGKSLRSAYGNSKTGEFIKSTEQFENLNNGQSVGQCSDIHYAMLNAYIELTGNEKAYLVNYQTGRNLHHTNLVIEEGGEIYIINYGKITKSTPGAIDPLRQSLMPGHGLAYRVFSRDGELTDKMVAHIDSPIGKVLREATSGVSSVNPFVDNNYTYFSKSLEKDGVAVKTFFSDLGENEHILGVAVNLNSIKNLPIDFSLESYFSAALAYGHQRFNVDQSDIRLQTGIIYINAGLGLKSPKLRISDFTLRMQSDLILEGGAWIKDQSDMIDSDSRFEGDGNLISRSRLDVSYNPTSQLEVQGSVSLDVMPTYTTSFPGVTDGSDSSGLSDSLGLMRKTTTFTIDGSYELLPQTGVTAGLTHQETLLGDIGEIRTGFFTGGFRTTASLSGAYNRDETPLIIPGAQRELSIGLEWCARFEENSIAHSMCLNNQLNKSIENEAWDVTTGASIELW